MTIKLSVCIQTGNLNLVIETSSMRWRPISVINESCVHKGCPTKRAPDVWDSAAFSSIFLASSFFLLPSRIHARPHAGTDYLQCQVFGMQFGKSNFRRSVTAARAAVFFISRRGFPFFGNASPSPNASFGIGEYPLLLDVRFWKSPRK
jgi:hypothetical protein